MQSLAQRIVQFSIDYDCELSQRYSVADESDYAEMNYYYLQFQIPMIALVRALKDIMNGDSMLDAETKIERTQICELNRDAESHADIKTQLVEIYTNSPEGRSDYHDIVVRTEKPRWQNTHLHYRDS